MNAAGLARCNENGQLIVFSCLIDRSSSLTEYKRPSPLHEGVRLTGGVAPQTLKARQQLSLHNSNIRFKSEAGSCVSTRDQQPAEVSEKGRNENPPDVSLPVHRLLW